ncbi:hypothetical protein FNZ56_06750 [Pseudoluteimonas lycopersici]|uniref:tRNA_anti-like n=1 Tax=Pseudoluteimonas lycopersici TaxID=1324796 RepID=A0A516V524_9GAMM|nr:hypothetical protein [Lysobacter lycopersici]QDQ73591.1 hypothetical protein FNZ56_06750 [Lysobacter lycopersici]
MNATTEATQPHKSAPIKATWVCLIVAWVLFLVPIPGAGLFVGWPLNLVAFILAIVVMARGFTSKGLIPLLASLVVSPIIYFIGIAVLAGAVSSAAHTSASSTTAVSSDSATAQPPVDAIKLSARDLFNAYQANEIAADGQYKGKPLEISGVIESIDSDVMDEPSVQLSVDEFQTVAAHGLPKDVAAQLAKGQSITLNCTGAGEVIGSPVVDHCSLR